jgi:deazaflavin-dependent oxidoreductase (nitroreductase family)
MWSWILGVLGGLAIVLVVLLIALVVTMRTKWGPGLTFIRRLARDVNKQALRTAGKPGAAAQVVRHVGRRSGRPYRTPTRILESSDGWVVLLPYGTSSDWLKNVLAAGSAEVEVGGGIHRAVDPRVVGRSEVGHLLTRTDRIATRVFRVDQFLALRQASTTA